MAFTDTGIGAGKIYDVDEDKRYDDFANKFNEATEKIDIEESKKKDFIRYSIVGVGAILILVALKFIVKNRK
jgi:hypothetical protein